MVAAIRRIHLFYKKRNISYWLMFYFLVYIIFIIKIANIEELSNNWLFGLYSLGVSSYILSRFALAYFYEPEKKKFDLNYQPTLTFGVPSKNEEENIRETIVKIAETDYPKSKFNIIVINDGSTDKTLAEMKAGQKIAKKMGVEVQVIDWKENRGKREGMAECVRFSKNDILIFIDSDSFVEKDTAKQLVKYFIDPKVGAVAGQAYVANENTNMLTKMQAVRYYVAFKAYKAAEALFGSVTCCSGCCAAYRRSAVMKILDRWQNQTFLGVRCTYGDDRSLTNCLLRNGYQTLFSEDALCYTFVPDKMKQFMRQQMRWKKSWFRENLIASSFIWRRNIIMSLSFYLGFILPLMAPIVVFRAVFWYPYFSGRAPWFYLSGLALMSLVYGLYYYIYTKDSKWFYGVLFTVFYTLILIWQLPWAILNIRDSRWGTR